MPVEDPVEDAASRDPWDGLLDRFGAALERPGIRLFSSAANAPRPRRPTDVLTLGLAVLGVAALVGLHSARPGPVDGSLGTAVAGAAPGILAPVWGVARVAVVGWPLVLLAVALVSRGRLALVRDGVLSVGVALGVTALVSRTADVDWPGPAVLRPGGAEDYPAVTLAVATAVIVAVAPHLGRPLRRVGHLVLASGVLGLVAVASTIPSGAVMGVLVGVVAGRAVLVALGSPGGLPTHGQVVESLRDLGIRVTEVEPAEIQFAGTYLLRAEDADGPLLVTVCGRDARDADLMARTWRRIWYRSEGPTTTASRLHQVEHEGFVTLLAAGAGLAVPTVVTAGEARTGDALLVTRPVGRPLAAGTPMRDELARGFWDLLAALHRAGLVHGAVDREHLGRTPDGAACLVSLAGASTDVSEFRASTDRVQLLTTTAELMGPERAVAVARAALGEDALRELLPYVQPPVLSRAARDVPGSDRLVAAVAADVAEATATEQPELVKLRRVTWGTLLQAGLLLLAGYALVVGLGSLDLAGVVDDLQTASVPLLVAALVVSQLPRPLQAVSTQGASPKPLPFGPLAALQLAISYINLAVPSTAGRVAVNIRFFQKQGVDRTTAVTIGALDGVAGFVVQAAILLVVGASGASAVSLDVLGGQVSFGSVVVWGVVAIVVVAALVLAVSSRLRGWVLGQLRVAGRTLGVLRDPRKVLQLLGGNAASQVLFAAGLALCVRAMGADVDFVDVLMANTVVSLFAGLLPVPGGIGVSEAGLTAALVASGVPDETAFAAVICYRVASFYLPPVWGFFAFRWLERRKLL